MNYFNYVNANDGVSCLTEDELISVMYTNADKVLEIINSQKFQTLRKISAAEAARHHLMSEIKVLQDRIKGIDKDIEGMKRLN